MEPIYNAPLVDLRRGTVDHGNVYQEIHDGEIHLYSYGTLICSVNPALGTIRFTEYLNYSHTTNKHLHEFLANLGLGRLRMDKMKQILELNGVRW